MINTPSLAALPPRAQTSPLYLQKKVFPNKRGPPRPAEGEDATRGDAAPPPKENQEQVKDDERGQEQEEEEEVAGKEKKIVR